MLNRFRYLLILVLFVFSSDWVWAQTTEQPFTPGEYARYGAYYNWHFIWMQNGEVEFSVDTTHFLQQKTWHLKAVGKTFPASDLIYTVRDTFDTFSNFDTFRPVYSRRVLHHAQINSLHQYWFDYSSEKITALIKQSRQSVYSASLPLQTNTFDLLATAYNFRKLDFSKLFIGQKVPFRMLIDRKIDDLYIRYLGIENVKTRNGKEFRCHKVSVYLLQGDFFREGEYMKVWFTDDQNHLPVQVETEILVGSVKALLLDTKSLKYPITSETNMLYQTKTNKIK